MHDADDTPVSSSTDGPLQVFDCALRASGVARVSRRPRARAQQTQRPLPQLRTAVSEWQAWAGVGGAQARNYCQDTGRVEGGSA